MEEVEEVEGVAPARVGLRVSGARLRVLRSAAAEVRDALEAWGTLYDFAARHPVASPGAGRGAVHMVETPAGRWAVRRYRRGGWARWLGERYLRAGEPRPFRELAVSDTLRSRGVATPEVVAAVVYPSGLWYGADLATRAVPAARTLAAVLFERKESVDPAAEAAAAAAGVVVRRLHDAGGLHADLNLANLVVSAGSPPAAWVLDLDRCRVLPEIAERHRRRMLDRFWRSAAKWEAYTGRPLERAVREAFRQGYRDGAV